MSCIIILMIMFYFIWVQSNNKTTEMGRISFARKSYRDVVRIAREIEVSIARMAPIITQVTYVHTGFGQIRPLCQSYFNMLL